MKNPIDTKIVGYVPCTMCPINVRLLNDDGIKGCPTKDRLEQHDNHIPGAPCKSSTLRYVSRRAPGMIHKEDRHTSVATVR